MAHFQIPDQPLAPSEEDLEKIYQLAKAGKSQAVIALHIGVSYSTLNRWLGNNKKFSAYPGVREAWEAGIAEHEEMLTSVLHSAIANANHKMQIPAAMFMLKAKHKWRERDANQVIVSTPEKAPTSYVTKDISGDGEDPASE